MSLKRKFGEDGLQQRRNQRKDENSKKHTLDSDEEDDNDETSNVLDENDIEGEEDTTVNIDDEQRMTAFNMQEEMEMGHFDKEGHFIWKNEREVRDNWLDNIDWQKVDKSKQNPYQLDSEDKGLGDDSDDDSEEATFNEIDKYKLIITYLKPKESINKAIKRLGGADQKLSSVERLKRKKAGTLTSNEQVTELTELANDILTATGNMDIYQETYEMITNKLQQHENKLKSKTGVGDAELDMYADDFDVKEKGKLGVNDEDKDAANESTEVKKDPETQIAEAESAPAPAKVTWELKRSQDDDAKIEGPFSTEKMAEFSNKGDFSSGGVWVRKCGEAQTDENKQFYAANRLDFELYL